MTTQRTQTRPQTLPPPRPSTLRDFYERPGTPRTSGEDRTRRQLRSLARIITDAPGPVAVADLGCGDGEATARAAALASSYDVRHTVVGVDWAQAALDAAQARGVHTVRGSLEPPGVPLPDASQDVVIMSEVVEHLVDTDHAVAEALRLLRPGGHLLLSTPNLAAWFNRLLLLAGVQPAFSEVSLADVYGRPGRDVVGHLRLFTRRALVEFLVGAGFTDVLVTGARFEAVPRGGRTVDRLMTAWPSAAAILLVHARRPVTRPAQGR